MSTMEIELNSVNNSDGSQAVIGSENEQKSITALDELLEQELKEDDSVDCYIKGVGVASEDSSEFGLNYEEAPVVSSSAFYSPKEDTSTDNNSLLEKELEDTLNKDQETPLTSDTDILPSGEEETAGEEEMAGEEETAAKEETTGEEKSVGEEGTAKDDTSPTSTGVEDTDEGTKETEDKGEAEPPSKMDTDSMPNEEKKESMINEETDLELKNLADGKENVVEDVAKETESDVELPDKAEMNSPSKAPNSDSDQTEKDTDGQSTKAESTKEDHKDVFYLVFHPKEQGNKNGEKPKERPIKLQCSETSTSGSNVIKINTGTDKSVAKAVLSIGSAGETKKGQEISKSIIVKKVTAKVVKNSSTAITKTVNECQVNDCTSEEPMNITKSSEAEEQPQNKSDHINGGESEKQTLNEDDDNVKTEKPRIVLTKKVYASRRSPRKAKIPPTTEDVDATNMDTQDCNDVGHEKVKERKTLSEKLEVNGNESSESTEKRTANIGTLKRKFEEICRISQEEESAAIEEIKKMKKETLDVLKKINAEMEKLKKVFLAKK